MCWSICDSSSKDIWDLLVKERRRKKDETKIITFWICNLDGMWLGWEFIMLLYHYICLIFFSQKMNRFCNHKTFRVDLTHLLINSNWVNYSSNFGRIVESCTESCRDIEVLLLEISISISSPVEIYFLKKIG